MTGNKVINRKRKEIRCNIPLHPGDIIMDELEARNITKTRFAARLEMKPSHFSKLLHGGARVSASIAMKLEQQFGITAEYWLRVQVYHDLFVERKRRCFVSKE